MTAPRRRPPVRILLASVSAALALAAPARAERWNAFERIPGAIPVTVRVADKPRVYFRITQQAPLAFQVEGPAQIRVTTRVEIAAGSNDVTRYAVRATEQGQLIEQLSTESSSASEARIEGGRSGIGKSRKLEFDVPAGIHRVSLGCAGATAVYVRVQQSAGAGGETPMISITPVAASRSVSVSEGEKIIPYYTVRAGQPVRLRVVGPTTLELLTRLDFDATMRGTAHYRLRVLENGRTVKDAEFNTTKAATATYTNLPDRIPSKFDHLSLPLGEGLHELAIELMQPTGGAAEIHARIPQPSVGNLE